MIPQVGAPPSIGTAQQTTSEYVPGRALRATETGRSDSRWRPETARAVDPPTPAGDPSSASQVESRNLNPPDPDAPAGPPPAFEATILDQQRRSALEPPKYEQPDLAEGEIGIPVNEVAKRITELGDASRDDKPGAEGRDIRAEARQGQPDRPERPEPRGAEAKRDSYDVPPSAEYRAEAELATIRRLETSESRATVDLSR